MTLRPQGNYDFTSEIEGRSNTTHPLHPVNSLIGSIYNICALYVSFRKLWLSTWQILK